jgi:hypothetical protein
MIPPKKQPQHYVDNKRLYTEMVKYINAYNMAKERDEEPPKVSNYIGECIWLIANKLSTNRNFIGYTYREEMIGDAIENTLRYIHNFDPDKTKNPFAYFTQIMYYAFLRRIEKEKKQQYIKLKAMDNSIVMNTLVELAPDDASHFQTVVVNMDYDKLNALADKYDSKKAPAVKKPRAKKGIDKFIGEQDGED